MTQRGQDRAGAAWWALAVSAALALSAMNLWFGALNQDEGWYLYAARSVADGRWPYLDFACTQGPVLPLVYALFQPLLGGWGVAGGRLLTAGLGWMAVALGAVLARRLRGEDGGRLAAAMAFALAAVNTYQAYFFTVVKTYALGAVLLTGGFAILAGRRGGRGAGAAAAGVLLALAAATRASLVLALPVVAAGLLVQGRRQPAAVARGAWFWFCAAAGLTLAVLFGPFLLAAPEALRFGLLDYHGARAAGGLLPWLVYRAAFAARLVQAYFVPVALAAVWLLARRAAPAPAPAPAGRAGTAALLWITLGAVTLAHGLAPVPYDDYQAVLLPLLAAGLGARLAGPAAAAGAWRRGRWAVLALCLLHAGASPRCQEWFAAPRDRIWYPLRARTPLAVLRETAAETRRLAGAEGLLLTQDTYLAVEAGLRVPAGMEMGPFCYYPDWPRARAEACRVLNRDLFEEVLRRAEPRVAAFSGYGLAIASPAVAPLPAAETARLQALLDARYRLVRTVEPFGQADTALRLYRRRAGEEPGEG